MFGRFSRVLSHEIKNGSQVSKISKISQIVKMSHKCFSYNVGLIGNCDFGGNDGQTIKKQNQRLGIIEGISTLENDISNKYECFSVEADGTLRLKKYGQNYYYNQNFTSYTKLPPSGGGGVEYPYFTFQPSIDYGGNDIAHDNNTTFFEALKGLYNNTHNTKYGVFTGGQRDDANTIYYKNESVFESSKGIASTLDNRLIFVSKTAFFGPSTNIVKVGNCDFGGNDIGNPIKYPNVFKAIEAGRNSMINDSNIECFSVASDGTLFLKSQAQNFSINNNFLSFIRTPFIPGIVRDTTLLNWRFSVGVDYPGEDIEHTSSYSLYEVMQDLSSNRYDTRFGVFTGGGRDDKNTVYFKDENKIDSIQSIGDGNILFVEYIPN